MAGKHEVTIDVVVRERGGKKVLKDTGDEAKKTGTKFKETGADAKKLGKEMFELEIRLRNAGKEFKRTGEMDLGVAKTLRRQQAQLRSLTKLRKDLLGGGGGGGGPGGKAGQAVGEGLTNSLMALRGPGIAAAGVLGVALAPAIGATIAAAVLGGVGAGGIIGGLALAAQDSRVQDAGAKLGGHAMAAFTRSAEPFVAPAIEAMGVLRGVVDDVSGDMRQAFATIAPVLVPLTQGLGGFLHQMMPGVIKALEGARPLMLVIGQELPKIGRAFGTFLSTIAEDPKGAIMAFQDLSRIIQGTIIITGNFISFLAKTWGAISPILLAVQGNTPAMIVQMGATQAALNDAAKMGKETATSLEGVGESAADAANRVAALNTALDRFFDRTLGLRGATREYEAAVDNLTQTVKENGKTLDERTEKGRNNEQAIDDNIRAIKELRQANIDNGMAVVDANAIYDQQLEQLRKTLLKLGLNKQEVNGLIDAIKQLPQIAEIEVRVPGLLDALARARELSALLGSGSAAARARAGDTSGYGGGRASGGIMMPGMSYDVAERGTGVERVKMLAGGGAIVQNADQWSAAGGGGWTGGGGGMQTLHVVIDVRSSGGRWSDFLAEEIRDQVAAIGGGSVQRTYGRNDR